MMGAFALGDKGKLAAQEHKMSARYAHTWLQTHLGSLCKHNTLAQTAHLGSAFLYGQPACPKPKIHPVMILVRGASLLTKWASRIMMPNVCFDDNVSPHHDRAR
jgi:hypothetical protein